MAEPVPKTAAREDRLKYGQSLRKELAGLHKPSGIRSGGKHRLLNLLLASKRGRVANLLPIKAGRMAASPFGFYRGAVPVMACDLSTLPNTGIYAQLCGDAHVHNLGAFEGQDGRLIFDINDFDETIRGPWEWDVKRMSASLMLTGRQGPRNPKAYRLADLPPNVCISAKGEP